jgi:chromosome segregation ATPase
MTESTTIETVPLSVSAVAALRRERGKLSQPARDGDAKAKKRIDAINAEIRRLSDLDDQIADQSALDAEIAARAEAKRKRDAIVRANRDMRKAIDAHRHRVERVESAVEVLVPALADLIAASDALWDRHRELAPRRVDALNPSMARHRIASYLAAQFGRIEVLDAERKLQNAAHTAHCPALAQSETEFYDRLLAPVPEDQNDA